VGSKEVKEVEEVEEVEEVREVGKAVAKVTKVTKVTRVTGEKKRSRVERKQAADKDRRADDRKTRYKERVR
jgi:hypothetical protein